MLKHPTASLNLHDKRPAHHPVRVTTIMQEKKRKMESELMPTRRTADEALIKVSGEIGILTGTMTTWIKNQDRVNEGITALLEKADLRDDEIEAKADTALSRIDAAKNKAIGIGIGSALGGGSIVGLIMRIFH